MPKLAAPATQKPHATVTAATFTTRRICAGSAICRIHTFVNVAEHASVGTGFELAHTQWIWFALAAI